MTTGGGIPRADYLDFLFNRGRGVRATQVDWNVPDTELNALIQGQAIASGGARQIHIVLNTTYNATAMEMEGSPYQDVDSIAVGDLVFFQVPATIPSLSQTAVLRLTLGGTPTFFQIFDTGLNGIPFSQIVPGVMHRGIRVPAGIFLINATGNHSVQKRAVATITNAQLRGLSETSVQLVPSPGVGNYTVIDSIQAVKSGTPVAGDYAAIKSFVALAAAQTPTAAELATATEVDFAARTRIGQHVPGRAVSGSAPLVAAQHEFPAFTGDRYVVFGVEPRGGAAEGNAIYQTPLPGNNRGVGTALSTSDWEAVGNTVVVNGTTYDLYRTTATYSGANYSEGHFRVARLHGVGADTIDRYGDMVIVYSAAGATINAETARGSLILVKGYDPRIDFRQSLDGQSEFNINSPSVSIGLPENNEVRFMFRLGISGGEQYWTPAIHAVYETYWDTLADVSMDLAIAYREFTAL